MTQAPIQPAGPLHRTVDLGREEEFVPWRDWFGRTMGEMQQVVPASEHRRLQFRVTLDDGRQFLIRQVLTHVVKGRCSLEKSRWNEAEAVCDVITGYLFMGLDGDGIFSAISVPPRAVASVECVLAPPESEDDGEEGKGGSVSSEPFGFYKRESIELPPAQREIEEPVGEWYGE